MEFHIPKISLLEGISRREVSGAISPIIKERLQSPLLFAQEYIYCLLFWDSFALYLFSDHRKQLIHRTQTALALFSRIEILPDQGSFWYYLKYSGDVLEWFAMLKWKQLRWRLAFDVIVLSSNPPWVTLKRLFASPQPRTSSRNWKPTSPTV